MSFLSWFSRRPPQGAPARKAPHNPQPAAGGVAQVRASKPLDQAEQLARKSIRTERRESLYMVIRDAMVRAGVLSAGYKFKVLSLDQQGQQFLVMLDLAREYGSSTARLSEIESLIVQSAKARFEILVTAVYWRMHDSTAVGLRMRRAADKEATPATASGSPQTLRAPIMPVGSYEARNSASTPLRSQSGPAPLVTGPAPLTSGRMPLNSGRMPLSSRPAPLLDSASAPLMARGVGNGAAARGTPAANGGALPGASSAPAVAGHFDPIEDDEVAAFKRALSSASAGAGGVRPVSAADRPGTTVRSGPISRSPLLQPSGFADTEMPAPDSASSDLSATQYGDLH